MHKIKYQWVIIMLFISQALFFTCKNAGNNGPPPEEVIAKSWKFKSFTQGSESAPLNILVLSSFNFNKNGRYEINLGMPERGTWRLSEDKKLLLTTPDGGMGEQEIDIEKLTETELILSNKMAEPPIRMVLVPE